MKMEKDILTGKRPLKDISLMHEKTREFLFIK
jgi:hypothetical protein